MADLKLVFSAALLAMLALYYATSMIAGPTGNFLADSFNTNLRGAVNLVITVAGAVLAALLSLDFAGAVTENLSKTSKLAFALIAFLGLAGVAALVISSSRQDVTCDSCNLIIVSYDSFKASASDVYGHTGSPTTPNLMGLAGRSIVFDKAHSVSTGNILMTADYSLLSSSYASTHLYFASNGHGLQYPEKASALARPPTLFSILKENGYSSYFVGPDSPRTGHFLSNALPNGSVDGAILTNGPVLSIFSSAAEAVGKAPAGKPFFLFVDVGPPPSALQPDEEGPYGKRQFSPLDQGALGSPTGIWANFSSKEVFLRTPEGDKKLGMTLDDVREIAKETYDGYLRGSDAAFGDLIRSIEKKGLLGKTIIVVTSAEGLAWNEPQFYTFFSLQNRLEKSDVSPLFYSMFPDQFSNVRVPLVMYVPGVSRRKVDYPVQTIDVAPTVLRFLGLPERSTFEGSDLQDGILARRKPELPLAFFEHRGYPYLTAGKENGTFSVYFTASMVSEEGQLTLPPDGEAVFSREDYARASSLQIVPPVLSGLGILNSRFPYTLNGGKVGDFETVPLDASTWR